MKIIKRKIFLIVILLIVIIFSFETYVQAGSIKDGINDASMLDWEVPSIRK